MIDRSVDLAATLGAFNERLGFLLTVIGALAGLAAVHLSDPVFARLATVSLLLGYGMVVVFGREAEDAPAQAHPVARLGQLAALAGVVLVPLATLPGQSFRPVALAGGFLFLAGVTLAMGFERRVTDAPADVDGVPDDPLDVLEDDE